MPLAADKIKLPIDKINPPAGIKILPPNLSDESADGPFLPGNNASLLPDKEAMSRSKDRVPAASFILPQGSAALSCDQIFLPVGKVFKSRDRLVLS